MKKLMSIFGAFFFTALVLTSCGEVNVKDLDKDIENEDDAVEAYLTLFEARLQLMESLKGPLEEIAALKDRVEELESQYSIIWRIRIQLDKGIRTSKTDCEYVNEVHREIGLGKY